jgi:hypothetical protein
VVACAGGVVGVGAVVWTGADVRFGALARWVARVVGLAVGLLVVAVDAADPVAVLQPATAATTISPPINKVAYFIISNTIPILFGRKR